MNSLELKTNFHKLIDSIENEQILIKFYSIIENAVNYQNGDLWNNLSDEDQQELLDIYEETENDDNLISNDEMRLKYKKWIE